MKKIILPFLAVLGATTLFSCGPNAAEQAQQDSIRVADSLRKVDSLRAADSLRIADSIRVADSVKKAEAEKAAAAAKSSAAAKAINEFRDCVAGVQEAINYGIPITSSRAFRKTENDYNVEQKCKRLMKDMTPEQKSEFRSLQKRYERLVEKWGNMMPDF